MNQGSKRNIFITWFKSHFHHIGLTTSLDENNRKKYGFMWECRPFFGRNRWNIYYLPKVGLDSAEKIGKTKKLNFSVEFQLDCLSSLVFSPRGWKCYKDFLRWNVFNFSKQIIYCSDWNWGENILVTQDSTLTLNRFPQESKMWSWKGKMYEVFKCLPNTETTFLENTFHVQKNSRLLLSLKNLISIKFVLKKLQIILFCRLWQPFWIFDWKRKKISGPLFCCICPRECIAVLVDKCCKTQGTKFQGLI